jgi:hypothetical protein
LLPIIDKNMFSSAKLELVFIMKWERKEIFSCFALYTLKKNHDAFWLKSFKFILVALTLKFWLISKIWLSQQLWSQLPSILMFVLFYSNISLFFVTFLCWKDKFPRVCSNKSEKLLCQSVFFCFFKFY